jgi:hypothetical protein
MLFSNASMWTEMLWFVAKYDDDTISHNVIIDLLSIIDQHNIIPPLVVLDILSHSSSITLAIVKVKSLIIHINIVGYF